MVDLYFSATFAAIEYCSKEAWKASRINGIGGSDAAAAIGRSKWMTMYDLWQIKMGLKEQEDISEKPAVKYGTEAEEPLRQLFCLDHAGEYEVQYKPNTTLVNVEYPFMTYSPDGLMINLETGEKGIYEGKTTTLHRKEDWREWTDQIPDNYYIQVLHGLNVTGYDFAIVHAQIKWLDTAYRKEYLIKRTEHIESLEFEFEEVKKFHELVESGTPPQISMSI